MRRRNHVIITGGSSGIGRALARLHAADGDHITIVARRSDMLEEARQEIDLARDGAGGTTLARSADVADREALSTALAEAIAELGPPTMLVTSAGVVDPGYFADLPMAAFEEHVAVNYLGTLYAIEAVLPAMKASGTGRLVLISSGAALIGFVGYAAYAPTKFAIKGLAESIRYELARDGIGISVVYPPDTETPMLEHENLTKPPETRAITESAGTWKVDDVARTIYRGVARGRFTIAPGWQLTALARLGSLVRPLVDWQFDRLSDRARRR